MFNHIPIKRALTYILSIGLIPVLFLLMWFISEKNELDDLQEKILNIQEQSLVKEQKQASNMAVLQHFQEADHFYIDKYLETLVFLEPEIETLQKVLQDPNFTDDDRIKKRLEFLTSTGNGMVFSEGVVQTYPQFQETTETLVHSVEINSNDLQKILARIEGVKMGKYAPGAHRPQLLITDFKLEKKKLNDKNEVYLLNIKLLKREYL